MELVKDLSDSGIIFYWVDEVGIRISPELATLNLAHEWYQQTLFDAYKGQERRVSMIDRRSDRCTMVRNYISAQANPNGRRISDAAAEVNLDLVKKKLKSYL